jgi:hypothetical protein
VNELAMFLAVICRSGSFFLPDMTSVSFPGDADHYLYSPSLYLRIDG